MDRQRGSQYATIKAKRLKVGVIYIVNATSSGSGYGAGRFRLGADGTVENLSR